MYAYRKHRSRRKEAARRAALDRQVQFAYEHRDHFVVVATHNLEVASARYRGDWNNSIRNAWQELGWTEAA